MKSPKNTNLLKNDPNLILKRKSRKNERNDTKKDHQKKCPLIYFARKEIKTREDLQDLLTSFSVKERLNKMLSNIGEMTNLAVSIRKDIKEFEKGSELDKEKLGKDIARLRFLKHELKIITFGKFQEILTGKVDDYYRKQELSKKKQHE